MSEAAFEHGPWPWLEGWPSSNKQSLAEELRRRYLEQEGIQVSSAELELLLFLQDGSGSPLEEKKVLLLSPSAFLQKELEHLQAKVLSLEIPGESPGCNVDLVLGCNVGHHETVLERLTDVISSQEPTVLLAEATEKPASFWASAGEHWLIREVASAPSFEGASPVRIIELRRREAAPPAVGSTAECPRVQTMEEVLAALKSAGACILEGLDVSEAAASQLPRQLFGSSLLAAPEPAEISERILGARGIKKDEAFRAHTDGHAYGDLFPDIFLLVCAKSCAEGGGNFLVDGYALLDQLAADVDTHWVPHALETRAVDQTSRLPSITPVLMRTASGRRALRCRLSGPPLAFAAQRVAADSPDPEGDATMLAAYHQAVERAADAAPRVVLKPGDALIVDNYRMFHGRDPFVDEERLLWRVWVWTTAGRGVPHGQLFSTPGDKAGEVAADKAS